MKHITFRPVLELQQHEKASSKGSLKTKGQNENSICFDISDNLLEQNDIQEKSPIGIETCMVYIAIPVSIAVWIGLIYLVNLVLF